MAFAKRYYSSFKSLANYNYKIEIWQENYSGSSYEIPIGKGGPQIKYKADSDNRYASIIASSLTLPIAINLATSPSLPSVIDLINFKKELRETLTEKQVYIHLYRIGSGTSPSGNTPLWSGFVLMDLSKDEDKSYPAEFTLTATDGLGILKQTDFVQTGAERPYGENDIWQIEKRFTYWIHFILNLSGAATTSEGAGANWSYSTSVNWYNEHMAGTTVAYDPLYLTISKCLQFYKGEEGEGNEIFYPDPPSCYEILSEILKCWGCRIVYWRHRYHVIQIDGYDANAGGTFAAPDNIKTRIYSYTNSHLNDKEYLGNKTWTPYELIINDANDTPKFIKKISGTSYDHSTPLKEVSGNFISGGNKNYFMSFPEPETLFFDASTGLSSVVYSPVEREGLQVLNAIQDVNSLMLEFELTVAHDQSAGGLNGTPIGQNRSLTPSTTPPVPIGPATLTCKGTGMSWSSFDCRMYFQFEILHDPAGGSSITEHYIMIYDQTTSTYKFVDKTVTPYDAHNQPYIQWNDVPKNGSKTQTFNFIIETNSGLTGACHPFLQVQMTNLTAYSSYVLATTAPHNFTTTQSSANATTNETFIAVRDANNPSTGWYEIHDDNSGPTGEYPQAYPSWYGITFAGTPNSASQWQQGQSAALLGAWGVFMSAMFHLSTYINNTGNTLSVSPSVGWFGILDVNSISGETLQASTSTNDTYKEHIGELSWGDTPLDSDLAALKIWDGSGWEYSEFSGKWGRNTLSGTNKFTNLLLDEYLKGGNRPLRSASMQLVMCFDGKVKSDGSGTDQKQYINPVGRIKESNPDNPAGNRLIYILLRGKFSVMYDEWDGEWLQFQRDNSLSINNSANPYTALSQRLIGNKPAGTAALQSIYNFQKLGVILTTTSSAMSIATLTSVPINTIGVAVLKDGDSVSMYDSVNDATYNLTLAANQGATDDALTINSTSFTIVVPAGAIIYMPRTTLVSQVDHKTRGTIAGMPVDADELGCIKYSGGDYTIDAETIIGVDLDYIKILPSDFLANDDNTTYSVAWKDGSGQTGVIPEDGALEMFAFISIPSGKTATKVDVWGSNAKALNVYEHDVNAGAGMGTAIGTGTVNTELDITDTASTATNYLVIKITTTATSNRIYGGKVTIIDTP